MPRNSEFNSYIFIKNDLKNLGWNIKNDFPEIGRSLGQKKPAYVVRIGEEGLWIIEAKAAIADIEQAYEEAKNYAVLINKSEQIHACIISGVAGNDVDGYLIKTGYVDKQGTASIITYNDNPITGLLSPGQARYLFENRTYRLNELVTDEHILLSIAEDINEEFHKASINKDRRATVMSAILLSMVSDTFPNINSSPTAFVKDINTRVEAILIEHSKREFSAEIKLHLPLEDVAKDKFKQALVQVYFLLRKINVKAAMNGGQDLLGKFYEVFLKYGNGAKDIGIVLTPRHITYIACKIIDVNASDIVFDPACGTGGFLVAAYDKVREESPNELTQFKRHKIFGVEQQANVATLAIVNMIFRGDGKNNIINDDCFANKTERPPVTKVLMNPPFALKKDDEKEYKFIDHALRQMAKNGLLFCVLPISVMYSTGANFTWRKGLLERHTLLSVISLSNELFYPQASVEPVLIVIKSGVRHGPDQKIAWVRIINDGYKKHKRKRLPTGENEELITAADKLKTFIVDKIESEEKQGYFQFKPIAENDTNLELIPANYLDNPSINQGEITNAMRQVFSEITLQSIKKELHDDDIQIV
jgi:type I restriction enzyme M protein